MTDQIRCKNCKQTLPASEFYPNRVRGVGVYLSRCKTRTQQLGAKYRAEQREERKRLEAELFKNLPPTEQWSRIAEDIKKGKGG